MHGILLELCGVALVLLVSFALAWLSRRPPPPRTRRRPIQRLFFVGLALLSLLVPLLAALLSFMPGASTSIWTILLLLAGTLAIALLQLRSGLRLLIVAARAMHRTAKNLFIRPDRRDTTRTVAHSLGRRIFKRDALRFAHRHAWASVALLLTGLSIALTYRIASVRPSREFGLDSTLTVVLDEPQKLPRPAIVKIEGSSDGMLVAEITLGLKPNQSAEFGFLGLRKDRDCFSENETRGYTTEIKKDRARVDGLQGVVVHSIPVSGKENGTVVDITVFCQLEIETFAETFTDRKIAVRSRQNYYSYPDESKPSPDGLIVGFSIEGASEIALKDDTASPISLPDNQRWLANEDGMIEASWQDKRNAVTRDALLVLIGGLLGLAASCLLEWIRPYIAPE